MSDRGGHGQFAKGNKVGPRWPKGKSGLPGGRWSARIREIRELAQSETEASFRVLISIRDNASEDTKSRIAACKEIIRYGIGEPRPIEQAESPTTDTSVLTVDELRNLARQSLADERDFDEDDDDDSDDGSDTSSN